MDMLLYTGNLLALAVLWLIVALAYRNFWNAVSDRPAHLPSPIDTDLFADEDPDEEFWLVPTAGSEKTTPAEGLPIRRGVLVGRGSDCDLRVDDPFVSEQHLRVFGGRRACLVEDLESANGYSVEGKETRGDAILKEGQWFSIGELTVRVERRRN